MRCNAWKPPCPSAARSPWRRIFRERDANGDEKLTIDEIPAERREGFERILEKFDVNLEEAQNMVMTARILLGWVDPADLVSADETDGEDAETEEAGA